MITGNQIATIQQTSTVFKGKNKKLLEKLGKLVFKLPEKNLTTDQAMLERLNGMGYATKGRCKEEMQTRLMNELMIGNKDFVAGAKEYFAKDAAKNVYKK